MARPFTGPEQVDDYNTAKSQRNPRENDWRLASAYCLPEHYGSWTAGEGNGQGMTGSAMSTLRRTVFDSTGQRALPKWVAILERLATPYGMKWMTLQASVPSLRKSYRVRTYFDALNDTLFKARYNPHAMFRTSSNMVYKSMGVYGMGPEYVGKRKPNAISQAPGMIYKACAMRDIFVLTNSNGEVDKVFRRYWHNLRQHISEWGPDAPVYGSMAAEKQKAVPDQTKTWEFFHVVQPRNDFDPQAWDARKHPFVGSHVFVETKEYVGPEEGYRSMPYLTARVDPTAEDAYGTSPAVKVISSMGGASTMKKSHLKQGNIAAEPIILAYDDGVLNGGVDLRPGHVNYGGLDRQGRELVKVLNNSGRWDIGEAMLAAEQHDTEDAFLVTLFQILTETPEMTATEVLERVAEKASLLSPTMGNIQSEKIGPQVTREIDVLDELGMLPEMPPELIEAAGEYEIVYTSPMAKGMYAEEVSGFIQTVDMAIQLVEATQDPSHLDHFDFDTALPEIADHRAVPTRWMADTKLMEVRRSKRGQEQQTQQMIEAAPAVASVAKTVMDAEKK